MKLSSLRTASFLSLAALLTACGAGQQETTILMAAPMQLASTVHSNATAPAAPSAVAVASTMPATGPNSPQPDCAAEGCASLRIIDGNAEAYRIDAMRGAAAGEGNGDS